MTEEENRILMQVDKCRDQMVEAVRRLARVNSEETMVAADAPFGAGVKQALEEALEISKGMGFDTMNLNNYIGYAGYGTGQDYVCAIGHVDVVPAGEGWREPPYSGHLEDGVLYGRGVLDNKGPILSCLYGLYACKEAKVSMGYPVRVIFGCDEESGFEDLKYYLEQEKAPLYGFTPDCKYPVVYSERGRAIVEINREISSSAEDLQAFFQFVNTYFIDAKNNGDRLGIDYQNEEYGMMEMRNYRLGTAGSRVTFRVTLSYPKGITIEEILDRIGRNADGMQVVLVHNYDPVVFEKDGALVAALQSCYEEITGLDGTPVTTTGGTYAKAMPGIVPFGPSFPGQKGIGHNPNEWMKVEDLMLNAKIYALSLYRLSRLGIEGNRRDL